MSTQLQIIIVDDEPKVTESLKREINLEFNDDLFTVVAFNNPENALQYVKENRESIFLVISDLRMPEMNGATFLTLVREVCPDTQTILLTAFTDIDSIQHAISASIQSLLFKPWSRESLVAEITKALDVWKLKKENALLKSRIDDMLKSAGDFQQKLFAQATPTVKGINFDISYEPFDMYHCGGDFYRIVDDGDGNILIILGDVTGHGPKPAMIAGMTKITLDTIIDQNPSLRSTPDKLLTILNIRLCSMLSSTPETLVGLIAVYINTKGHTLAVATAGLPPVIHIRDGSPELLNTPNHMLGVFPETAYFKTERFLHPGDRIVIHTDGLTESVPAFFTVSQEETARMFTERTDYGMRTILGDFKALLPGAKFTDDVTVISMEIEREE